MSSEIYAHAVASASLATHYKEVESFQRQRAKAAQRTSKALAAVAGVAILGNLGQAWTIVSLLPLEKIVPVYLWVRGDGTIDNSVTMSRLPATQVEAVRTAALWEYVRLREGYSFDSAQYGYDADFRHERGKRCGLTTRSFSTTRIAAIATNDGGPKGHDRAYSTSRRPTSRRSVQQIRIQARPGTWSGQQPIDHDLDCDAAIRDRWRRCRPHRCG